MAAPEVVKAFNVVEDVGARFIVCPVARPAVQALLLQGGEEALHCRVIPTISLRLMQHTMLTCLGILDPFITWRRLPVIRLDFWDRFER